MKLIQFVLASKVSGGYYQKWKHLSATEKTERQVTCDAKTEETKALFVIENGAWNCPNLGLARPRVVCDPTCLPGYEPNWTDGSISKPKKDHPRFMTRCGNPANIAKRNLPSGIQLACTPIPEHPCMATANRVTIPNGSLSLNTELTPARATFDVVCDWGETMGKIYCNRDSFPFWKNPEYEEVTNACADKCGYDPCDGLDDCNVIVDACEIDPVRNNLRMIAPASLNYKVSADVFCGAPSYTNDYWRNVLHVTDGNNEFTPGSRTFALWRSVDGHIINIHTNNPNGDHLAPNGQPDHSDVTGFACTPGEWHTFSVEVRQDTQMPSQLNADIQVDGTSIRSVSYPKSGGKSDGDLQFFVADDWYNTATNSPVKNFIYQTLPEIDCGDPCAGLDDCNVIVDGCEVPPVKNNQIATVPASLNYKVSADIYCAPVTAWDEWRNVLHVTDGNDHYTPGCRTFAIWRNPSTRQLNIHTNNPNGNHGDHSDRTPFYCTEGQWHSFSVEVRQDTGVTSTLNYDIQVDGNSIRTGSYPASGGKSTGDLQFFVSDDWWLAATGYNVKNFVYQTFAEI